MDTEEESKEGEWKEREDELFGSSSYSELIDCDQSTTNFCKNNPSGFVGNYNYKEGYVIGPSMYKKVDKTDPEAKKYYEIYR